MDASFELFGFDRGGMINRCLYDFIPNERERLLLRKALEEKGSVDDLQIQISGSNPEKKIALISASLESGSQGELYIQGILQDITLLKRAEEITLESEKLEAKSNVIRTLAHEIRNPLNNISVSIDQLKSSIPADDAELLSIVYRGGEQDRRTDQRADGLVEVF
ncbi:MAG: histidine kinase dimerization/phospho-acceptor domain-containing protein [Bacteroidota bacterium]